MNLVALITGGGNGIGRAVAHRFARAGMTVVIADYDHAAAEQVRGEVAESGAKADALSVDVTVAREVMALVSDVAQRFGRIDILTNIAGGSFYTKRIEDFTWTEFKRVIDTNLKGTFLMCREVARLMQKQRAGRIINTASNYGVTGSAFRAPYSAAKAGVIGATKALAQEVARRGVTVNAVAPGFIKTDMTEGLNENELKAMVPLKRFGLPEEVAHAVGFLASPEASYITAEVISVNGGLYS